MYLKQNCEEVTKRNYVGEVVDTFYPWCQLMRENFSQALNPHCSRPPSRNEYLVNGFMVGSTVA